MADVIEIKITLKIILPGRRDGNASTGADRVEDYLRAELKKSQDELSTLEAECCDLRRKLNRNDSTLSAANRTERELTAKLKKSQDELCASEAERCDLREKLNCSTSVAADRAERDLMAELKKSEDNLRLFVAECCSLSAKLNQERWLFREQEHLRKLAEVFIPEHRRSEYLDGWPNAQHDWSLSSPVRPNKNAFEWVSTEDCGE